MGQPTPRTQAVSPVSSPNHSAFPALPPGLASNTRKLDLCLNTDLANGPWQRAAMAWELAKGVGELSMTKREEECCGRGKNSRGTENLGLANLARRGHLGSLGHRPSQTCPLLLPPRQQGASKDWRRVPCESGTGSPGFGNAFGLGFKSGSETEYKRNGGLCA